MMVNMFCIFNEINGKNTRDEWIDLGIYDHKLLTLEGQSYKFFEVGKDHFEIYVLNQWANDKRVLKYLNIYKLGNSL